jgi:2-haloacid dehalogenase
MHNIQAVVFDAYGTLYDVHSVITACESKWPGQGESLSKLWRAKQLEYSWLHSMMERYVDFRKVTTAALEYACESLNLPLDDGARSELMESYSHLKPFPEVPAALQALKPGRKLVIFSNGSPDMLDSLVANTGLSKLLDGWISADEVRVYKPDPRSYKLATEKLGLPADQMLFISSNPWDVAGSKAFGFQVAWVNRSNAVFDKLGITPDLMVKSLAEIPAHLNQRT